jgi:hypothetical protein
VTASQVAQRLSAKKVGRDRWLALCPAHPDRHPSLSIWPGDRWVLLRCQSHGCEVKDILSSVGLTMPDLSYTSREWQDPKALREEQRIREAKELREANIRIGELILRFAERGYTLADRERDTVVALSAAALLTVKPERHRELLLRGAMERIQAADHCRLRGMLPNV